MKKLTAAWLKKAEDDLGTARKLLKARRAFNDQICYHYQQAAEKFLKAVLQELGQAIPYTHDLRRLINLLLPTNTAWRRLRRGAPQLTRYAGEYRYPGITATRRQARAAFTKALAFRELTRRQLGLRTRRHQ